MNKCKKIISLLFCLTFIFGTVSFAFSASAQSGPTIDAEVSKSILKVGDTQTIKVKYNPGDGQLSDVTAKCSYKSTDSKVVSVSEDGTIKALKKGLATIEVSYGQALDFVELQVGKYALDLQLTKNKVKVGKTAKINVYFVNRLDSLKVPSKVCEFKSCNKNIAKVSSTGKVTGVSAGKVKIKVTYEVGSAHITKAITVKVVK